MMRHPILLLGAILVTASCGRKAPGDADAPLKRIATIALPGVAGRIDHMAVDLARQRLFVGALGNNTLEVVDLKAGTRLQSLRGFHEPQGVGYDAATDRVIIANGDSGDCDFLDGATLKSLGKLHLGDDADDIRMDAKAREAVVGYGSGALALVDMRTQTLEGTVSFRGHPEAFTFPASGHDVYVNVPSEGKVVIVDRATRLVKATWPVREARANFPMALDEADHRLFVGCRAPSRLLVYDTLTGKVATTLPIPADTDDLYYDAEHKRLYASCGGGSVSVIEPDDPGRYRTMATVTTAPGARTSLFVPELSRLYVAIPRHGAQNAEIMVFAVR
jgi:DNA-binding beta-propeller fold protein YncE